MKRTVQLLAKFCPQTNGNLFRFCENLDGNRYPFPSDTINRETENLSHSDANGKPFGYSVKLRRKAAAGRRHSLPSVSWQFRRTESSTSQESEWPFRSRGCCPPTRTACRESCLRSLSTDACCSRSSRSTSAVLLPAQVCKQSSPVTYHLQTGACLEGALLHPFLWPPRKKTVPAVPRKTTYRLQDS